MAPDRWVVLDDTDTAIKYTGSWFIDTASKDTIGNFGPPYLHTLHGTSTNGTISVEFNGTAVGVSGSNIDQNTTHPDPTFECFVDDVSIGRTSPFQFAENNWPFCNKDGLPDGLHKLRIDVTVMSPDHTFWLDQIKYNPSPAVPLDNKVLWLGNTDPAITYDSHWEEWPANLGNITTQTNSVALVKFIGTSVTWMAFTPTERPHTKAMATWSIDGGAPNQFILQGLSNSTSANTEYNQVYFTTPELQQGSHTLTVTFLGSGQTTPLSIGSLFIKNGSFPSTSTQTSSTQSPVSSTDTQAPNTQSPQPPLGTILGGVLGGLALLLLILVGSFLYRRRRLREKIDSARLCLTPTSSSDDQHPSLDPPNFYDVMSQVNQHRIYAPSGPSTMAPVPEQPQLGAHWRKQREANGNREPQGDFSLLPGYALAADDVTLSWTEGQDEGRRLGPQPVEDGLPRYTRD